MKPSNIIVSIVLLLVGIGADIFVALNPRFSGSWAFVTGIVAALVVVVVAADVFIALRERKRRRLIRRIYIGETHIYSSEYGLGAREQLLPEGRADEFMYYAADLLASLDYDFAVTPYPDDFKPTHRIETDEFAFRHDPSRGIVVDTWRGSLIAYGQDGETATPFASMQQLESALVAAGIFR